MKKDLKGMKYLCMFVLGFCLGMWAAPAYADNEIEIAAVANPDLDNLNLTITFLLLIGNRNLPEA